MTRDSVELVGTQAPLDQAAGRSTAPPPPSIADKLKQPKDTTSSAASAAEATAFKTLADQFDVGDLGGLKFADPRSASDRTGAMPPQRPPLRKQTSEENLVSTEVSFTKLGATLTGFMQSLSANDPRRDAMARDKRLADDLIETLKRIAHDDGDEVVQDAWLFRKALSDYWSAKATGSWMHYPRHKQREIEREYDKHKEKAQQTLDANPLERAPADKALGGLEALRDKIADSRHLDAQISLEQKARLERDLGRLRDLVNVGKQNGWLVDNDPQVHDPKSHAFMEDRVCHFAKAIEQHIRHLMDSQDSGGAEDRTLVLDRTREAHAKAAEAFLSDLEHARVPPKAAWFVPGRRQIADALATAHPTRGREIMDSLPPDFLAGLIDRGVDSEVLAQRLENCSKLLHVSQSGFREGTGRFAFFKGIGKLLSNGRGRKLSSWQAAQVRRTVAMLALAGATEVEIRQVRRKLIAELRNANLRIGRGRMKEVEASISAPAWGSQKFHSLSDYRGEIDQWVADEAAEEQEHWRPLANLHTAMDNLSAVLEAGASASDAKRVFDHDMSFLGARRIAKAAAERRVAENPQNRDVIGPDHNALLREQLPRIAPPPRWRADSSADEAADVAVPPHPLAHLAKPFDADAESEASRDPSDVKSALENLKENRVHARPPVARPPDPSGVSSAPVKSPPKSPSVIELAQIHRPSGRGRAKYRNFGHSVIMHDLFRGDTKAYRTFDRDPVAYRVFKGDEAAYKAWGHNAALYEAFGSRPGDLEGKEGAQRLKVWVDRTYGEHLGEELFARKESFADGIGQRDLKSLGKMLLELDSGVERAHARAGLFKETINALYGKNFGSTVGDSLVDHYIQKEKNGLPSLLDERDLQEIEKRLDRLPLEINYHTVSDKLADMKASVPSKLLSQWKEDMEGQKSIEPTGKLKGSVNLMSQAGAMTDSIKETLQESLKKNLETVVADDDHPEVSKKFLTDIKRSKVFCHIDDEEPIALTEGNAVDTLKSLTGGDPTVMLNLSNFVQQAPIVAATFAIDQDISNDPGTLLGVLPRRRRGSPERARRTKVDVRKSGADYVIDYRQESDLEAIHSDFGSRLRTNFKTSRLEFKTSIKINEEDLKAGNLDEFEMVPIDYEISAQLDPFGLIYPNQA